MQGTGGEVVPFDRGGAGREDYDQAIQLWFQTRDVAETLSREEIGAMQGFARVDAQRKAIIIHLANYYREHDRADVAPGVLVVQTLLSDNEKGGSTISQPTLAKLFGRSISSIGEAQKRLRDGGAIVTGRGRYAITHPVIPRAVTKSYNHLTWLVSAVCEQEKVVNLPAPQVDCQSTGQTLGLDQSTGQASGLECFNQPVDGISINRPDAVLLHLETSTTLKRTRVAALGIATALGTALPAAAAPAAPPAVVQPVRLSLAEMADRMMDAAGNAIANPAGAMGLLTFSELQRWLADGCDFETDILQTIRAASVKMSRSKPGSIGSWKFFTNAIADAKAARLAPMPAGRARAAGFTPPDRDQQRAESWLDREIAEAKRKGEIA